MLKLTPEMEAEYATFWDAMNIRVVDSGKTGIELRDKTEGDPVLMFFPRSVYEYLTVCYMDLYKNDTPESARESIFQEGRDISRKND